MRSADTMSVKNSIKSLLGKGCTCHILTPDFFIVYSLLFFEKGSGKVSLIFCADFLHDKISILSEESPADSDCDYIRKVEREAASYILHVLKKLALDEIETVEF